MGLYDPKPCPCGSGETRQPTFDGHGIFLTFVCSKCKKDRMATFRPDIMKRYQCDESIEPEDA